LFQISSEEGASLTKKTSLIILLNVFLVSFTGLVLQVTLTRIFSITLFYHYAFMAVSVALFGWGLGGTVLHFFKQKFHTLKLDIALVVLLVYSLFMPIYLFTIRQFQVLPNYINLCYVISLIPFFLAGTSLAFFYSEHAETANKLYLADLAGASFACLIVEPILFFLGAESTILLLGVISSVACVFLVASTNKRKTTTLSVIVLIVTSAFFAANVQSSSINVLSAPDKPMYRLLQNRPELRVSFTKWNSFSRVDVVEGFEGAHIATIYVDAGASTDVYKWDGQVESLQYLKDTIGFLPYCLVKNPKTLNIGSGGGVDVLIALVANSSKVTAVELNPIVIEAVNRYRDETGDIYNNPKVELCIDEGRSFVKRSNEKFDVITLTLVDSWAAISSGGYALAENYLYTKEAFIDYINHLTDNGLLAIVRWNFEVPRLISTTVEAFEMLGEDIHNVGKHVAVVMFQAGGSVGALYVLKKTPFTQVEAEEFMSQTLALGSLYWPFYVPYVKEENEPYHKLFEGSISLEQYYNEFSYRVDAVTDDSPYFFNIEKMIPQTLSNLTTLGLSLIFLSIVIPLGFSFWAKKRKDMKQGVHSNPNRFPLSLFIVYFSALGLGYMLVEIAVIQKFILFLGYPTRALAVILFSLLLSSGIGSFVSGHFARERKHIEKNILLACLFTVSIALIYVFTLPKIFDFLLPLYSTARIAATVLLIFPLGFFMGIPFPSGIRILHESSDESIPWIWGINGSMSVLGSIFAATVSIVLGFSYAILLGIAAYFIAFSCATLWAKRRTSVT
jgi:spermidine synthase